MSIQVMRRTVMVEEYHRMGEAGIFSEDERIELINGEIIKMTPIGSRHASCVKRLNQFFTVHLKEKALVSVQDPIQLDEYSEVQPDVALLHPEKSAYMHHHPTPQDVYLIIEVSDSSLSFDRDVKLQFYAKAGIIEVWLVDLLSGCIEIYQEPSSFGYGVMRKKRGSDVIFPSVLPEISIAVEGVIGKV
jgi:Uma2 family endonuclease